MAHTAKQGAFRTGALLLPSERSARFGNPAWPGGRTANFAAFGAWSWVLPKNAESLRNSDALMHVAVPRRRGPAELRGLFSFLSKLRFSHPALRAFCVCEAGGGYHYPRCALRVVETLDGRLSKRLICRFLGLTCSSLTAAQNTVLFGHGIPTEKRLNRQRLIPRPAGRCGSNTAVSRSPGLSRGPRCPAPARSPWASAPAP